MKKEKMKISYDFSSMTDIELMEWFYIAKELRDKKYLEKIKKEISMRWMYA